MMGFSSFMWILGLVFFSISFNSVLAFHCPRAATCEDCVRGFLDLCKPYLVGEVDRAHRQCCNGLYLTYYSFDFTRHETCQTICQCIRKITVHDQYKPDRAKKLPVICFYTPFPVPLYPSDNDCE
ncbi:hypothetical protein V6N13_084061 [Hibiscus sabdariffa]